MKCVHDVNDNVQALEQLMKTDEQIAEVEETEAAREVVENELSFVLDALNSSLSGVSITNLEGRIAYANPAFVKMFEYGAPDEVLNKNAADLFAAKEIKRFADVKAVVDQAEGETEEFTVQRKDGTTFLVEASCSNVTDKGGNIVGRMVSFVDITKRRLAQERLESEKLRVVLETTGAVCHEFNQPLQALSGYCELLERELPEDNRLCRYLGKIQASTDKMVGLLERLQRITRYETKPYPGGIEIIDIDKATQTA